jgi:tetratricopeptide (TPR) repeat protein
LMFCCTAQAAELPWDLTYQSALRDHPIADNEFMRIWPLQHPQRPIHEKLAAYQGAPITASLLIESPDSHAGDAQATWFIVTRNGAQACPFHPKYMQQKCKVLDRERVNAAIRQIMVTPDPPAPTGTAAVVDPDFFGKGKPVLMNYMGYLSAYIDGKVLQRPISLIELDATAAGPEGGRLAAIFQRALATDADDAAADKAPAAASAPAPVSAPDPRAVDNTELNQRKAITEEVLGYLRNGEYKKLDALRKRLLKPDQRTASGVWKLAVYYSAMKSFPGRTRDAAHWVKLEARARAWEKQAPASGAASVFHAYVLMARGLSYRGTGFIDAVPKEDLNRLLAAMREAEIVLVNADRQLVKDQDPELYRLIMNVAAWSDNFRATANRIGLDMAIRKHPDYHELYFTAALFGNAMWQASPDEIEEIATRGAAAGGADAADMYARVYWYANQEVYSDNLFEDMASLADWDRMKTSFDALVAHYPDPWNLNAYAYFACRAKDYPVMDDVLRRIGERRVFASWGYRGAPAYDECLTHSGERRVRRDAADIRKRDDYLYRGLLYFASGVARKQGLDEEALRALSKAEQIANRLYSHPGMSLYYHRARAQLALRRYEAAAASLTTGLKYQPDYFEAFYYRGLAYENLGRKEDAQREFEQTVAMMQKWQREGKLTYSGTAEQQASARAETKKIVDKLKQQGLTPPADD